MWIFQFMLSTSKRASPKTISTLKAAFITKGNSFHEQRNFYQIMFVIKHQLKKIWTNIILMIKNCLNKQDCKCSANYIISRNELMTITKRVFYIIDLITIQQLTTKAIASLLLTNSGLQWLAYNLYKNYILYYMYIH